MSHAEANKIACLHCPLARCNRVCVCYDGKPTEDHAEENACPAGKFPGSAIKSLAHGAVGLVKAALRINRADDETISRRKAICAECPEVTVTLGIVERCAKCGCAIKAKILVAEEKCPLGKW